MGLGGLWIDLSDVPNPVIWRVDPLNLEIEVMRCQMSRYPDISISQYPNIMISQNHGSVSSDVMDQEMSNPRVSRVCGRWYSWVVPVRWSLPLCTSIEYRRVPQDL